MTAQVGPGVALAEEVTRRPPERVTLPLDGVSGMPMEWVGGPCVTPPVVDVSGGPREERFCVCVTPAQVGVTG